MKHKEKPLSRSISMFGSERGRFLTYLFDYQEYSSIQLCSHQCFNNGNLVLFEGSNEIFIANNNGLIEIDDGFRKKNMY